MITRLIHIMGYIVQVMLTTKPRNRSLIQFDIDDIDDIDDNDDRDFDTELVLLTYIYENPFEFGMTTSFAYTLEEDFGEIVVATTRVETMLSDIAIVVHPNDERYKHLHGKHAIHPFNGRRIPIVCDEILVDP
ncbi:hypothetical protein EV1_037333 [Malus domestica]